MNSSGRAFPSQFEALMAEHRKQCEEAERLCAEVKRQIEHLEWLVDSVRREWKQDFFRPLQDAIRAAHGCESRHVASFAVRKVCNGQVLWVGMVDEFALDDSAGTICYAWQHAEEGRTRTFIVPKQEAVDSPQAAVQSYLTAKSAPPPTSILA